MASMSQIKFDLPGIMIAAVSVFAAYSFATPHTSRAASAKKADSDYVWIKYDCNNNGQVEVVSGGSNYVTGSSSSNPFSCPDENATICSVGLPFDATEAIDGDENNRKPISSDLSQYDLRYCAE